eukprot:TRINITY_DN6741_c0_g1_i1.p1 TRINITY_DN6741_c0_g1~~TRINITY_DN6741_c0_g1_i1.p1  ORF type:complete len:895 (+),score=241.39 TRINITY_DN6741_c0_g1_i1:42-2726(+)
MSTKRFMSKCTMLLKLAVNRIQIHRAKKTEASNKHKREIADLLDQGKDELARVRTISVVFEDYMVEVLNTMELYCETISARIQLLGSQKSCPHELKEAVCSIIYAAPYLEVDELKQLRTGFIKKYGKKFPRDCVERSCVNNKLVSRLQHNPPEDALVNYYLSAIAKKHNVDWELPQQTQTTFATPMPNPQQVQPVRGGAQMPAFPQTPQQVQFPQAGRGGGLGFPTTPGGTPGLPQHGGNGGRGGNLAFPNTPGAGGRGGSTQGSAGLSFPNSPGGTPQIRGAGRSGGVSDDLASRLAALSPNSGSPPTSGRAAADELDSLWQETAKTLQQNAYQTNTAKDYAGCENAVKSVTASIGQLDAASLYAAAGQLESNDSETFSESERKLLAAGNALQQATKELIAAADSADPRILVKGAAKVAAAVDEMCKATTAVAAKVPDAAAKQELLEDAKTAALSAQRLIIQCQQGHIKRGDRKIRSSLLDAANNVSGSLNSLIECCRVTGANSAQGIKEVENARAQLAAQLKVFESGGAAAGGARGSAAQLVDAARAVAGANAKLVMAKTQPEIATAARAVVESNERLLREAAAVAPLAPNPRVKAAVLSSTRQTSLAMDSMLGAVLSGDRAAVSPASSAVAGCVNKVVESAQGLPGGSSLTLAPDSGRNLDEVAQRELVQASKAIELIAQQLASRPRKQRPAGAPIDTSDISEAILGAAQAIAGAAGVLLATAAEAQADRVKGMKNPQTKHLYHNDPTWADGLISAARAVVSTTNHLVQTANSAAQGNAEEEAVVASAKAVAAATAHLVAASRARSSANQPSQLGLEKAARSIAAATAKLVQAVKAGNDSKLRGTIRKKTYNLTQQQAAEIEAQTRILKLEKELEMARRNVSNMRKDRYQK